MKKITCIFGLLFSIGFQFIAANAQDWKKVIPSVSTCEDVKRIFNIEKCEFPRTDYETSDYKIEIEFSEKDFSSECGLNDEYKNIAKGTVLSVYVRGGSLLKEFESDLSGYEIEQVYDLPDNFIYKNKSKGIEFETTGGDKEVEKVVLHITYRPSAENIAKFGCSLQWKEIKPFVSTCEDLKRVFKIDKCTFPTTKIKTARFSLTVDFPKNICSKRCNPKTGCWKVSKDTILSTLVDNPFSSDDVRFKDFAPDWQNYIKEPVPYLPDLSKYTYPERGIELEVQRISNTISKLKFFPSPEDEKKYKCRRTKR